MNKLVCETLSCDQNVEGFCSDPNVLACYNRIRPGPLYAQIKEAASDSEDRLEQIVNLLASWKEQLKAEYGLNGFPVDVSPAAAEGRLARRRFIDELESVLTNRPLL